MTDEQITAALAEAGAAWLMDAQDEHGQQDAMRHLATAAEDAAHADGLGALQALGGRFHGVTLDFRRSGTDWPSPWRVRLVSTKNEREDYRLECFGDTAQQAVEALRAVVAKMDVA